MAGDGVDAVEIARVDVGIVLVLFARGVVCDVDELGVVVVGVSDSVFVIAAVPDLSCALLTRCEGIAAFDVLNAFGGGFVYCWRDEDVRVVGHDDEAMELEAGFVAMLEESGDEEFGVGCSLEVAMLLEC
jgi:hypothetical protein